MSVFTCSGATQCGRVWLLVDFYLGSLTKCRLLGLFAVLRRPLF
jgi:hypothetical protein